MRRIILQSNPVFHPVHISRCRYIVMKGSAGSGKSADTAQEYILRLLQERERNLLCIRKAEISNRYSTFAELSAAIRRMGVFDLFIVRESPMSIQCKNGSQILFRGMRNSVEREKLKSITVAQGKLTDIWIEEATELTQQDFEILDDRLRGELPAGLFYQIKLTFNPVSASHWIKRVFFDRYDPQVLIHHSTYLDNRFIDSAYRQRMSRRKEIDPEGYRIYGLGEWGETEGLILTNWKVKDISQNMNFYDDISVGQDFGYNHANVILVLGFRDGALYILRELYVQEKDTDEIIRMATEIPKDRLMYCDSAEPDRIRMWRRAGFRAQAVCKEPGSISAQIDWLKARPILIHPDCTNTIREISQWKWKKDSYSGLYLDEPEAIQDDAMAALRYGIEGQRKGKGIRILK